MYIGLQWVRLPLPFSSLRNSDYFLLVLHPRHKLAYFETTGWSEEWIETAKSLVRERFDMKYASHVTAERGGEERESGENLSVQKSVRYPLSIAVNHKLQPFELRVLKTYSIIFPFLPRYPGPLPSLMN
jgi:hypothetical protein